MIDAPKTLAEAKARRYGRWGGMPNGRAYDPAKCAWQRDARDRGDLPAQCSRGRGQGPAGLYCGQHSKEFIPVPCRPLNAPAPCSPMPGMRVVIDNVENRDFTRVRVWPDSLGGVKSSQAEFRRLAALLRGEEPSDSISRCSNEDGTRSVEICMSGA